MPQPILPPWQRDVVKTKQFQDWANGVYPGSVGKSDGMFGPRTAAAWNKYGDKFNEIANRSAGVTNPGNRNVTPVATSIPRIPFTGTGINPSSVSTTAPVINTFKYEPKASWMDRAFSEKSMKKVAGVGDAIAPFASNIANAFRKPPIPTRGTPNPYVTLQKINLQEERNSVERNTNAANRGADRSVDGNTAEAIKAFNRGTEFDKLTSINDRQNQANIGIANQQAQMDATITAGNNAKIDEYNNNLTERTIAQQREQSANAANAGDKLMTIRNENKKAEVDLQKANIYKGLFEKSGVDKRYGYLLQQAGIPNPRRADGQWLPEDIEAPAEEKTTKKANGGLLRRVPKKAIY